MSDDPNELVYVEHDDGDDGTIDQGAWVPRSSLRQWASSGWVMKDPPEAGTEATQTGRQMAAVNTQIVEAGGDPNQLVVISNEATGGTAKVPMSAYLQQWRHSGWTMPDENTDAGSNEPPAPAKKAVAKKAASSKTTDSDTKGEG